MGCESRLWVATEEGGTDDGAMKFYPFVLTVLQICSKTSGSQVLKKKKKMLAPKLSSPKRVNTPETHMGQGFSKQQVLI